MSQELDPNAYAYKKLFGKRATNMEFAIKVSQMATGDMQKGTPPMTYKEIQVTLGYKDKKSIQRFMNLAKKEGIVDESKKEAFKLSDYKYLKSIDDFIKLPSVQTWVTDMKGRARGGKPFGGTAVMLRRFKVVCDTLEVDPMQFISGINREEILNQTKTYMNNFIEIYFRKEAKVQYAKNWSPERYNRVIISYAYAKSVRDFMRIHGYNYPEGTGGVMSQSISSFHGNYSDVRMTIEEYRKGKKYIKDKWGLDSDIFRWFSYGVEALPRKMAIFNALNNYEIVNSKGKEYYSMVAIETKTSHYKGGKWKKIIYDEDTKESIRLVQKRSNYVIEERTLDKAINDIYPKLKEVYKMLNKTHLHCRVLDDESTSYFLEHCSHTLRHCGAQIWLLMTKWNLDFVASMGWKKVQELSDSYGEMPESMRMEILEDLRL